MCIFKWTKNCAFPIRRAATFYYANSLNFLNIHMFEAYLQVSVEFAESKKLYEQVLKAIKVHI